MVKVTDFITRKMIHETATEMLENGNERVSAVDVASQLFPQLVAAVGAILEEDRTFRIADSQDDIPHTGVYFVQD